MKIDLDPNISYKTFITILIFGLHSCILFLYVPFSLLDQKHAMSYFNRGLAEVKLRDFFYRAIKDFTEAINILELSQQNDKLSNKELSIFYCGRAGGKNEFEDYIEAIKDYDKGIKILESLNTDKLLLVTFYNDRGVAKNNNREHKKAIEDFTKAIEISKSIKDKFGNTEQLLKNKLSEIYNNRGIAKSEDGSYKKGIKDFIEAIDILEEIIPKNSKFLAEVHNNMGIANHAQKNYDEAITNFQQAIELNNDYIDPYEYLRKIYEGNVVFFKKLKLLCFCIAPIVIFITLLDISSVNICVLLRDVPETTTLYKFPFHKSFIPYDQKVYLILLAIILILLPYLLPFIKKIGTVEFKDSNYTYINPHTTHFYKKHKKI